MGCLVAGCIRSVVAKGLCGTDYRRYRRNGGSLELARAPGLPRSHVPWRIAEHVIDLARQAAELEGVEPGDWLETVILSALPWESLSE